MELSFYLKNPNSLNETVIFCRMAYDKQKVKVYTTEKIHPKNWNKVKQRAKEVASFPQYPEFNYRLQKIASSIAAIYVDWQNKNDKQFPPPDVLKSLVNEKFSRISKEAEQEKIANSFWGFFDQFIERCKNGSRLHLQKHTPMANNTIRNFTNLYKHLQIFQAKDKRPITFESIDLNFRSRLIDYLTVTKKQSPNTIGKLITNIKVLLREALEMGLHSNTAFTSRKFTSISYDTETIYLTNAEINELMQLDLTASRKLDKVRDMFIVGCYTGLRFSDLSKFDETAIQDEMIEITTIKTATKVHIPIRPAVANILAKYGGTMPKAMSNQKFNQYIKEICSLCPSLQKEISIAYTKAGKKLIETKPKYAFVSSHTARRSFATNEFDAGDLQVFEIKAITGHATDKAFYRYIRKTPRETAQQVAKKWKEREIKTAGEKNLLRAV